MPSPCTSSLANIAKRNEENETSHRSKVTARQRAHLGTNLNDFYEDGGVLFFDHSRKSCLQQHKAAKKHRESHLVPAKKPKNAPNNF